MYLNFSKNLNNENAQLQCKLKHANEDNGKIHKKWQQDLSENKEEIQKLRDDALRVIEWGKELQSEISNLSSQLSREQILNAEYEAKYSKHS